MARVLPMADQPRPPRGVARGPVAVLSLHSHRERSFLDDVTLHEASGALRAAGIENDLVVACVVDEASAERLAHALRGYPTLVYERVWSASVIVALAEALPEARLVRMRGEHELTDAPAHDECAPDGLVRLIAHLLDRGVPDPLPPTRPNLHPIYVDEADRPKTPSYPIRGNSGCPYSADARANPLFAGLAIPNRFGRGCSFCTTGNAYEHRKPAEALASTLDQLRYIRAEAPGIEWLVLRDQNPFAYLTELVEAAERESLGPFTLLVESRADWWLQNGTRFERALAAARASSIRIAPFLVGVESFSQRELDRFNKGITADLNVRFLHQLRAWTEAYAPAVDLSHGAFGFILFTPWTTLDDLRENLRGIEETRLHELRGRLLLSRARLYPDTALYYLAERDGLLATNYASRRDDASARYGYLPAQPWRFADARVAQFAEISAQVLERRAYRDELQIFRAALAAAEDGVLSVEEVERRMVEEPRQRGTRRLAEILARAPTVPVSIPAFGIDLLEVYVDDRDVLFLFGQGERRARVRLRGPGSATVESADPELAPVVKRIAARLGRSTTAERWELAAPIVRALRRQS